MIDRFGADTVRLFVMFAAPPEQSLEWNDEGVEGAHRFIKRLWHLAWSRQRELRQDAGDLGILDDARKATRREIHTALKQARFDYDRQQFNTVVSAAMKIVNALYKLGDDAGDQALLHEGMGIVLRLLAPIAPHVTHHLWRELGYGDEILDADCILVTGSNTSEAHPIVAQEIKRAVRRGATLIVVDPRRIELAELACVAKGLRLKAEG